MEQKLAEYRARKAREFKGETKRENIIEDDDEENEHASQDARIWSNVGSSNAKYQLGRIGKFFQRLYGINGILKVAFWFSLWMFFIKIEFGAVFFALSLIVILYYSMSYDSRGKDEMSAYSVFNKDFKRLDGTFTAEQFDKSLRKGGGLH